MQQLLNAYTNMTSTALSVESYPPEVLALRYVLVCPAMQPIVQLGVNHVPGTVFTYT